MKKKMFELLLKNKEDLSLKNLNETLITDAEISKAIKELGQINTENFLNPKTEKYLKTKYIGNEILMFKEVDSTNTVAEFLAENGTDEGTIIISEIQTHGKGRHGRKWESPKGGVWLSIILKPDIIPSKAPFITLATGVAVAKTLQNFGAEARIKWPNDILINDKKVSGILTEASTISNKIDYVIVGVGIDNNFSISQFPEELQKISTTLENELKTEVKDTELISKFLNEFEKIYDLFKEEKIDEILNDWRKMSATIGNHVEIKQGPKSIKGYVVGINDEGALVLEENNGNLREITSGECIIKKEN